MDDMEIWAVVVLSKALPNHKIARVCVCVCRRVCDWRILFFDWLIDSDACSVAVTACWIQW